MELPASELLFDEPSILAAVDHVAEYLNTVCQDGTWLILCVMNGGLVFTADLMKRLEFKVTLDFVQVSRYHNKTEGTELTWHAKPSTSLQGAQILLVDDIFDEGETMLALDQYCIANGAERVLSVVLLEKTHGREKVRFRPEIVGLKCPDKYVFGYGMDYEGYHRNLPEIYYLEE